MFSSRTKALHVIFDQLIFNIENIMLLLIILPFIFTKVSKSLQYDMLQNTSISIIAMLQSIVCWCIMILHYIRRQLIFESDIMYRFFTISGIKLCVSKKKRFFIVEDQVFLQQFQILFHLFLQAFTFFAAKKTLFERR